MNLKMDVQSAISLSRVAGNSPASQKGVLLVKTFIGIVLIYLIISVPVAAQQPRQIFDQKCATCHGAAAVERAPEPATLRQMTPERIYEALTSGTMRVQAEGLPDETRRGIAEFLSDRKLTSSEIADARTMSNRCPTGSSGLIAPHGPAWNGWGVTPINARFQPAEAAGLTRDQFK